MLQKTTIVVSLAPVAIGRHRQKRRETVERIQRNRNENMKTTRICHSLCLNLIGIGVLAAGVNAFGASQNDWHQINKEEIPSPISADLAIGTTTTIAAFNSNEGSIAIYTTGR